MTLTPSRFPDRFPALVTTIVPAVAISPEGPKQPLPGPLAPEPSEPPQRDPQPNRAPQIDPQREPARIDPPAAPPEPGDPLPHVEDPPLPDQPNKIIGEGLPAD